MMLGINSCASSLFPCNRCRHSFRVPILLLLTTISIFSCNRQAHAEAAIAGDSWQKLVEVAEDILGDDGVLVSEDRVDALVDLHIAYSRNILGRNIPSSRIATIKIGLRNYLIDASQRYGVEKRTAALRLMRDIAANRAIFEELLSTNHTVDTIEELLNGYMEHNLSISYTDPISIKSQLHVGQVVGDLAIVGKDVRMSADTGTVGHSNMAIDAGETITLSVPIENRGRRAYRSTSGILKSQDPYVKIEVSKVTYVEPTVVGGDTMFFAPGQKIVPNKSFIMTIRPDCPDGHMVQLMLHILDSDHGELILPFSIKVWNIGPLDFGATRIDDDEIGASEGNNDGMIDPSETVEYVLSLHNQGSVVISDVKATLFSSEPSITIDPRTTELRYSKIDPAAEYEIPASFILSVTGNHPTLKKTLHRKILRVPMQDDPTQSMRASWFDRHHKLNEVEITITEAKTIQYIVTKGNERWSNPELIIRPEFTIECRVVEDGLQLEIIKLGYWVPFRLLARGKARGHMYSWMRTEMRWIGPDLNPIFALHLSHARDMIAINQVDEAIAAGIRAANVPGYSQDIRMESLFKTILDGANEFESNGNREEAIRYANAAALLPGYSSDPRVINTRFNASFNFKADDVFVDERTGKMWSRKASWLAEFKVGGSLRQFVASRPGGYDDWRIPTEDELRGLSETLREVYLDASDIPKSWIGEYVSSSRKSSRKGDGYVRYHVKVIDMTDGRDSWQQHFTDGGGPDSSYWNHIRAKLRVVRDNTK